MSKSTDGLPQYGLHRSSVTRQPKRGSVTSPKHTNLDWLSRPVSIVALKVSFFADIVCPHFLSHIDGAGFVPRKRPAS
jgi:hypothetical protein